jgi:hypothetical protein
MTDEPRSGDEALTAILGVLGATAKQYGRELDPTCLPTFEANNIEKFKEVFTDTFWQKSKSNLQKIAELHGLLSAKLSQLLEPDSSTVSLAIFKEAGVFLRAHCPVIRQDVAANIGIRKKGDWCTWP